ncbi:MAG: DUF559 domain-containing protein [Acidimicrobiia bacterium]|nr:DUF559 domain-containing protein [Acidimicrobiia bacterium]
MEAIGASAETQHGVVDRSQLRHLRVHRAAVGRWVTAGVRELEVDRESDARRDAALGAAGFRVMRITEQQLRECPEEVVAIVRTALASVPVGV